MCKSLKINWLGIIILVGLGVYFFPWKNITWGKLEQVQQNTVTVSGEAKTQQANQVASFNAGVSAMNADKETAVNEVNQKITELIDSVKEFGIENKDIKTQNMNVYQNPKSFDNPNAGMWQVDNYIVITLRDIERTSELTDILTRSGATNVNGPNFSTDDTQNTEVALMDQAMQNAREKGEALAKASGRKLGGVVNVAEGATGSGPILYAARDMGGGGSPVEPGSATVYKTLTVTFELK